MSTKGIIFSAPMVRALLDGRKTQTRRLIKPKAWNSNGDKVDITIATAASFTVGTDGRHYFQFDHPLGGPLTAYVSLYVPGDRLYVREACRAEEMPDTGQDGIRFLADTEFRSISNDTMAAVRWLELFHYGQTSGESPSGLRGKGIPSIHMPRWASRMWLAVTDVRVQRLREISEQDAIAEGIVWQEPTDEDRAWAKGYAEEYGGSADIDGVWIVPGTDCGFGPKPRGQLWGSTAKDAYHALWNSLHTAEGERWEDNPWICAVSFSVHLGNVDEEQEA